MSVFVWGEYADGGRADGAVEGLVEGSFPPEEISVLVRDAQGAVAPAPVRHKTRVLHGAVLGAVLGAVAFSMAVGGDVSTAALGAVVGAVSGASGGLLWWRQEVDLPNDAGFYGRVLVGITAPEGRADAARAILREAGAERVGVSNAKPPR